MIDPKPIPAGRTPIAAGREADVYALDDDRVLRRYRNGDDATGEARVMTHLGRLGYPVPEVFEAHGPDLVMRRLTGPTMAESLIAGDLALADAARMLADLLGRLHALPAWPAADLRSGSDRMLHLDLHPDNVILAAGGPVVIDWHNVSLGPPDLDTAFTALILAQVALGSIPHPVADRAGELLDLFVSRAPGDPLRLLDEVVAIRSQQWTMSTEEVAMLPAAADRVRRAR